MHGNQSLKTMDGMQIDKIIIEGFSNIEKIELNLSNINALIAFNNYGKSNVLRAIDFGITFITDNPSGKLSKMGLQPVIPINTKIADKPYKFELCGNFPEGENTIQFIYAYSFDWNKTARSKGKRIREEYLKIKNAEDVKYKTYINRNLKEANYLSSPTGRCDKPISIETSNLILNKILNYDDLFYLGAIRQLNSLQVLSIDTLKNPNTLFRTTDPEFSKNEYSLALPDSANVGFFVYSLKKLKPDTFELFKDAVKTLLPSIEDFEPIEIDLKHQSSLSAGNTAVPFSLSEKFYDIRVKECYNNQQTSIELISSGSKKIFFILAMSIASELNRIPLIMFEELENSIHPALFQNLLMTLDALCENTKILTTSHSPYLIKYLDIDKLKIGVPNNNGIALFLEIRRSKLNRLSKAASDDGVSIGDYIFSLMLDAQSGNSELLNEICF